MSARIRRDTLRLDDAILRAARQDAILEIAHRAVVAGDLRDVLDVAMRSTVDALHVELADVLEKVDGALVLRAGIGWESGATGLVVAPADERAPCAQALTTNAPFLVEALLESPQLDPPPFLVANDVVSLASVVVHDVDAPFGTLNVYSRTRRIFTEEEARFLTAVAGIVSLALQRFRIANRLGDEKRALATIIEVLPVGVCSFDAKGQVVQTNAAARALWQQASRGSSVHEALFSAWHADGRPLDAQERPILRSLREGTETRSLELIVQRADGERRNVLATTMPLRDGEEITGAISVTIDVTETRRVEREQRLLAEASVVLSSTPDLHAAIASFARILLPHLGDWCVIFVLRQDEVEPIAVARAPEDDALTPAFEEPRRVQDMRGLGLHAAIVRGESIVHPRVERPDELTSALGLEHPEVVRTLGAHSYMIVPMKAAEKPVGAVALVFSRTPRRFGKHDLELAEDLARRAAFAVENALLHSEREEDARLRAEFAAIASHDLRNPLAAISSMAALLARAKDGESMEKVRSLAERIQRNAARMDTLIRDLLDLETLRQGGLELHLEEHEAGALALDVVEMLRPVAEQRRQRLEAVNEAGETLVRCDRDRIMEVLSNLIGNAVKFVPERGHIEVRVQATDDAVRFSVSDDGPGIDPEHVAHVFQRFWRAEQNRKSGVGLGLAIAKGIVDAHGGVIRAENGPSGGACLSFDLPTRSAATGRFSLTSKS